MTESFTPLLTTTDWNAEWMQLQKATPRQRGLLERAGEDFHVQRLPQSLRELVS